MAIPSLRMDDIDIGFCRPHELAPATAALDETFIIAKGRRLSLAQRFPDVLSARNLHNVLVARAHTQVISTLVIRYFSWRWQGERWRGAMIGMVWTHPDWRGRGLASRLLEEAKRKATREGAEFAVLWSNQADFYLRLGWQLSDSGCLGTVTGSTTAVPSRVVEVAITDEWVEQMEAQRRRWLPHGMLRERDDYRHVPIPADSVTLLKAEDLRGHAGYALLGQADDTAILYEMIGHPASFSALWNATVVRGHRVLVNDVPHSASWTWLQSHTQIEWNAQRQALWQACSERARALPLPTMIIPYFDRI